MSLLASFGDGYFSHSNWVREFARCLFDAFGDLHFSAIAMRQTDFAEAMIVPLTKAILTSNRRLAVDELRKAVELFFQKSFEKIKSSGNVTTSRANSSLYNNKKSMKTMLEVAQCIHVYNIK